MLHGSTRLVLHFDQPHIWLFQSSICYCKSSLILGKLSNTMMWIGSPLHLQIITFPSFNHGETRIFRGIQPLQPLQPSIFHRNPSIFGIPGVVFRPFRPSRTSAETSAAAEEAAVAVTSMICHRVRMGHGNSRILKWRSWRTEYPGWWLGHPSEKYEFVNIWKIKKWQPDQTTNQYHMFVSMFWGSTFKMVIYPISCPFGKTGGRWLVYHLPSKVQWVNQLIPGSMGILGS